ncbi:hypothetical protein ACNKHT_03075 [Shigella flexneri]
MSINNFILVIIAEYALRIPDGKNKKYKEMIAFGFLQHIIPFSFNKAA